MKVPFSWLKQYVDIDVTAQELEDLYPDKTPKERENVYLSEHKTAFIMQIGDKLRSGKPHDGG